MSPTASRTSGSRTSSIRTSSASRHRPGCPSSKPVHRGAWVARSCNAANRSASMTAFPAGPEVALASENSFDIVSKVDLQEVDNAIHQAQKEIGQRWDFRGSTSEIRREAHVIHLHAGDDYKLRALIEILSQRLAGRKVPLRALSFKDPTPAFGGTVRQEVGL